MRFLACALLALLALSCNVEQPTGGNTTELTSAPVEDVSNETIQDDGRFDLASRYLVGKDFELYMAIMGEWERIRFLPQTTSSRTWGWDDYCWSYWDENDTTNFGWCREFQELNARNAYNAGQFVSRCDRQPSPSNNVFTPDRVEDIRAAVDQYFDVAYRGAQYSSMAQKALVIASRSRNLETFAKNGQAGILAASLIIANDLTPLLDHNHGGEGGGCPDGNCEEDPRRQLFWTGVGSALSSFAMGQYVSYAGIAAIPGGIAVALAAGAGAIVGYQCYLWWCSGEEYPETQEEFEEVVDPYLWDDFPYNRRLCDDDSLLWDLP